MWRNKIILAIAVLFTFSCGTNSAPDVVYVFPDGFRGVAKIIMDSPNGISAKAVNGVVVLNFSNSGILKIQGKDPIMNWHRATAKYASGGSILIDNDPSIKLAAGQIALHHLGFLKEQTESWYFIGDRNEAEKAANEAYGFPSN